MQKKTRQEIKFFFISLFITLFGFFAFSFTLNLLLTPKPDKTDAVVYLAIKSKNSVTKETQYSYLTGFIIKDDGRFWVLTAAHFLDDCEPSDIVKTWAVSRVKNQVPQEIKLFGFDKQLDVALFRFVSSEFHESLALGTTKNLIIGQTVTTIGHPLNIKWTQSSGKIINIINNHGHLKTRTKVLLHDAVVEQGNSGSPLLDENQKVIGINVGYFKANPSLGEIWRSFSVAISIDDVKVILPKLRTIGLVRHPICGMAFENHQFLINEQLGQLKIIRPLVSGIMIYNIEPNSVEQKSGLRSGDVILSCDGKTPKDSADLYKMIYFLSDFDKEIILKINRYGKIKTIVLEFPAP